MVNYNNHNHYHHKLHHGFETKYETLEDSFTQLYWFTVEFGLVDEEGIPKAYGAGLLSGNEELQYCVTDRPERRHLDIKESLETKYPESGLQPLYFVASSLEAMRDQMR